MTSAKPPRARQHCKHYSYERGPRCAVGVDMSAPGSSSPCMPNATGCPKREDWTDEERAEWEAWEQQRVTRMFAVIAALPELDGRSTETVECPNCDGKITYIRVPSRAYIECSTPDCAKFEANVRGPWPPKGDAD